MKITYLPLVSVLVGIFLFATSCERILYPYPSPEDFEYYSKDFVLEKDSKLKTDLFYASPGIEDTLGVYTYLKFFPDGGVYFFGGTSMVPDTVYLEKMMDIKRRKNGIPESRVTPWGYFMCEGDSIKLTFINYGVLSSLLNKYVGVIKNDTILFEKYEEVTYDSVMHKIGSSSYIYYNK